MAQVKENMQRMTTEFNALFLNSNEKEKEVVLAILQSLGFAQSVMGSQNMEQQYNLLKQPV